MTGINSYRPYMDQEETRLLSNDTTTVQRFLNMARITYNLLLVI